MPKAKRRRRAQPASLDHQISVAQDCLAPHSSPENMTGTRGNYLLWMGDEASGTCRKQIYDSEARRLAEVGGCENTRQARRRY